VDLLPNLYYYDGRQLNGKWLWTRLHANGEHVAAGACKDGTCNHASQAEARDHETQRIRDGIKNGERKPLSTPQGWRCIIPTCTQTAYFEVLVYPFWYYACDDHLTNTEWFIQNTLTCYEAL
jgi:hypothetical protein